jgi:hypothetical protein
MGHDLRLWNFGVATLAKPPPAGHATVNHEHIQFVVNLDQNAIPPKNPPPRGISWL